MKKILLLLLTLAWLKLNGEVNLQENFNLYKNNFNVIRGWFDLRFLNILIILNEFQNINQINGNLAEIGVCEGKSFIPLYLIANDTNNVVAIDIFDQQHLNRDKSGDSNLERFKNNIKTYCDPNMSKLEIIEGDSSLMTAKDYLAKSKNNLSFRIFSIDGSHRPQETMIDLSNAAEALSHGGIIIIDDFFNYEWPGVADGVTQFLKQNHTIKPFFIGFNKVVLTHTEYVSKYQDYLEKVYKPQKYVECYGSNVAIYSHV